MKAGISQLILRRAPSVKHHGLLQIANRTLHCAIGKNGMIANKCEGDGATPRGAYRILYGYWRRDRKRFIRSIIPFDPIKKTDGWCDDVRSANYNQSVSITSKYRFEKMWREDRLYDVCLVLDYNIYPTKRHRGSAIFLHIMADDRAGTEGCVALSPKDMRYLLSKLSTKTRLIISI